MEAAAAGTTTNSPKLEYFRGQPPAWTLIQGCLTVFALLVLLRALVRHIALYLSKRSRSASISRPPAPPTVSKKVHWTSTNLNKDPDRFYTPKQEASRPEKFTGLPQSMDDQIHGQRHFSGLGATNRMNFSNDEPSVSQGPLSGSPRYKMPAGDGWHRHLMSRPPPAPPLTPPELSSTVFTLEGRPQSRDSFMHLPNPDYTSATETSPISSSTAASQGGTGSTNSHPRRMSYHKTVPIGVPASVSRQSSACESDLMFSSSSYPPTSPLLPPAPPSRAHFGPDHDAPERGEISLHGEIVSVLDKNGAGWSRHTRVYGGAMCLACAAAGKDHGEGGFYGPNVLPEEMR